MRVVTAAPPSLPGPPPGTDFVRPHVASEPLPALLRPVRFPRLRRSSYERLLAFNCGELTADELLAAAGRSKWDQCEACFFVALSELADGRREAAAGHFRDASSQHCNGFLAQDWSDAFLTRMKSDPMWPIWIPVRE